MLLLLSKHPLIFTSKLFIHSANDIVVHLLFYVYMRIYQMQSNKNLPDWNTRKFLCTYIHSYQLSFSIPYINIHILIYYLSLIFLKALDRLLRLKYKLSVWRRVSQYSYLGSWGWWWVHRSSRCQVCLVPWKWIFSFI